MSTLVQQVESIRLQVNNNLSLINGTREPGFLYNFYGNNARYGCYVSNPSADLKTLTFDDSDSSTVNPSKQEPPLRPEEYANVSIVYGEVFLLSNADSSDIVLDDTAFPSSGYTRNDIVYLYVGNSGPSTGISTGASTTGTPVDATIPSGSYPVARIVVDDSGISQINDLRFGAEDIGGGEVLWPDGSITGGNSNGSYTKWPNGDLECSTEGTLIGIACTTANPAVGFRSGSTVITYPALFVGGLLPVVVSKIYEVTKSCNNFIQNTAVSKSGFGLYGYSNTSGTYDLDYSYIARGTWK